MIGTLTLNPSIDREILVDELVKDDAIRARRILDTAGGKGVNVSKVIRELRGRTMAFAVTGGLEGKLYGEKIRLLGFPYHLVTIRGHTRLNVILTDHDDATQTRISAPGPQVSRLELDRVLSAMEALRPRPWVWALGGTLPAGADERTYRRILLRLRARTGARCVVDCDGPALRLALQARPFMVKPNEFELERLMARKFSTFSSYAEAAHDLVRQGVALAVVSLGPRGAVFASEAGAFVIPGVRVPVRSKVGAGDALIGGVLVGLERRMNLEDACRMGMAASHSAVMQEAPRLCVRSQVMKLFGRFKVRRLALKRRLTPS